MSLLVTPAKLEEKVLEFLKENCIAERGIECRTLGCALNGGWDPKDIKALAAIEPTCPIHELGKLWRMR